MSWGQTFKIDTSGDIIIDSLNNIEMISGEDKVAQDLTITLKTLKGEDIFHTGFGLNFQNIMDVSTEESVEKEVREALYTYPYLSKVLSTTVNMEDAYTLGRTAVVDIEVEIDDEIVITTRLVI